ncbi:MAG: hypothetical protein L6414_23095 [Hydrogenophaga sp.]|uniref:hypothetical protein n=1 Tax=Hydrogenophaga sp. TaxID=1904254 RepID=UPI0025C2215F|nr:hypothetical protein [Hydrogenophaga sp.]MBU4279887.1 hypothetical protein [Gammaproteobacteria bacterium]MCG2658329.1 hypothetical protein [Hydrogenophaga sp.]
MNLFICFLIPFLAPIRFSLVGEIAAGEVLVPLLLLLNWKSTWIAAKERIGFSFLLLIFLYLVSLVLSDIYRQTPPEDYLRGWAKVTLTGIAYLAFLGAFSRNPKFFIAFVFGFIASIVTRVIFDGSLQGWGSESYKWRYGIPLTFFVFCVASLFLLRHKAVAVGMMLFISILSLVMNYRSLAGVSLIATLLTAFSTTSSIESRSSMRILVYCLLAVIFGASILQLYIWAAPQGFLGEVARDKFAMQSTNGTFSLLSGRAELIFSFPKIVESPIVGWGSWAKDIDFVFQRAFELELSPSQQSEFLGSNDGLIPTHSHIFSGWLEAGLFGGIFWIAFAWITFRNITYSSNSLKPIFLVIIYLSGSLILWDLFFSPYGAGRRAEMGAYLAFNVILARVLGFNRIITFATSNSLKQKKSPILPTSALGKNLLINPNQPTSIRTKAIEVNQRKIHNSFPNK